MSKKLSVLCPKPVIEVPSEAFLPLNGHSNWCSFLILRCVFNSPKGNGILYFFILFLCYKQHHRSKFSKYRTSTKKIGASAGQWMAEYSERVSSLFLTSLYERRYYFIRRWFRFKMLVNMDFFWKLSSVNIFLNFYSPSRKLGKSDEQFVEAIKNLLQSNGKNVGSPASRVINYLFIYFSKSFLFFFVCKNEIFLR